MIRGPLFNLWFYGGSFGFALAAFFLSFLAGPRTCRAALRLWTAWVLAGVRHILGARIEVRGRGHLPPRGAPLVLVPKHQSELDSILLINLFPDLGAVAMAELARYPLVGRILRKLGYILVPVSGGPAGRTAAVVEGAGRVLAEGRPVLIYPEGTLMSLGARERYRAGAFRICAAHGVPATPVAMSLGVIWPRREWRKSPGSTGAVEFLAPIAAGADQAAFMARLEATIEAATMALIREHAPAPVLARAEDRFARGVANEE